MRIDLPQPPPQVKTLEQAQALIEVLWSMLRELTVQIERQTQLIERQAMLIGFLVGWAADQSAHLWTIRMPFRKKGLIALQIGGGKKYISPPCRKDFLKLLSAILDIDQDRRLGCNPSNIPSFTNRKIQGDSSALGG